MAIEVREGNTPGSAALQLEHIYIRTQKETKELVDRISDNMKDALERNVPHKTGNMKRAVANYKMYESPNFYRVGVGFRRLASADLVKSPGREFHPDPTKYIFAQNYGDTTVAKMMIPWEDVNYSKIPRWIRVRDGKQRSKAEIMTDFPRGIPIRQRTIQPKGFIEKAQAETLALVGTEAAKFMRGNL